MVDGGRSPLRVLYSWGQCIFVGNICEQQNVVERLAVHLVSPSLLNYCRETTTRHDPTLAPSTDLSSTALMTSGSDSFCESVSQFLSTCDAPFERAVVAVRSKAKGTQRVHESACDNGWYIFTWKTRSICQSI